MSRLSLFTAPFVLGFDNVEERIDRMAKSADGYPPYNIERVPGENGADSYKIAIAVAGFAADELAIVVEDNQLIVRGKHLDQAGREYLHRGIATRQFQRAFLLADGMQVGTAALKDGLLVIPVERPQVKKSVRRINIQASE